MNDRALNMLGICRRAGALSSGHDASIASIVKNTASLCILCEDASPRLKAEIEHAASYDGKSITVLQTHYSMKDIAAATGTRARVLTVDDEGLAKRIAELYVAERGK